ncbi:hypothetical protein AB4149_04935 [Vibrio cyclitrophicus]|uniref:hypothetical protein n=1 Tax=Vibrio cyclitrophicus TaxID=47951 RepID=UPI000A68B82E|nr:hypothetical protein [Vibrio cyclitrophicus]
MRQIGTLGLAMLVVLSANASAPTDATKTTISVANQVKEDLPFSYKKALKTLKKFFAP